ncbi:4-diphosphocytidyl-2-C-methyl-D-erythritol kinase [Azorhizobium oxalatiphilum]|uniref:4-diphosphocytidyl-2-C-methyl-D-erythritol kinase n=1 Tax=Azorhizobium oxalatiphilum TaxID=980631 RepID=A0A917CL08_9HYPH|nr:4-(cytidine 5'-diphospho)-2-C-methyl-D-erythritol kinase [Azorhizobium oxalatiphilum]GGF89007.1 4-diphosphocytidyl-2-C-methyl-D-erythritol kinase [Azorhizobium oxalatiphilum]
MQRLVARAPAKVNLTLRILRRRPDGFHDLASVVAFAGAADIVTLDPLRPLGLSVAGPSAASAGPDADNLILKAARAFLKQVPDGRTGHFELVKRLPVAAGLGGGSSDAAAALRLLAELNDIPRDDPRLYEAAQEVGADVPVCLAPEARIMEGIGERLSPPLGLPLVSVVLVNCRVPVPTADVFRALNLRAGEELAGLPHAAPPAEREALLGHLALHVNDLEPPAERVAPEITEVKALLAKQPGVRLVRMSGSGATVFAITDNCRGAATVARRVAAARPDWWVRPTVLR